MRGAPTLPRALFELPGQVVDIFYTTVCTDYTSVTLDNVGGWERYGGVEGGCEDVVYYSRELRLRYKENSVSRSLSFLPFVNASDSKRRDC